ncbi:hypothetical protein NE237_010764 [Protea cynaroides]|uniref:NADH:quinone oxidoreductase/Mrp antiporter transmembrane domain-containing protein n=1 Tax=Protea cynaroides TaxID=273540 RepID=A0A9Q0L0C2_9MAGN|nr:hypothetical protein NE237_010764 [Protea cynaroides]
MKAVLSRMLSIGAPISVEEDDVEFSFAMEYGGPPVSYNLPRAAPIDIKRIPTAAVVAPASLSDRVSLPVVQPLLSSDPLKKKLSEDLTRGSEADVSPGSCNGSLRNRGDLEPNHLLLEILAILSMILGNLIAITQTSMKRMLAYSSIGQIGYVIIGIIVGDSNDGYANMITYMLFYISMNLGTFARIVSFGLKFPKN